MPELPTPLPRLTLVAALSRNRCIGRGGGMPWHLPEDLKRLRAITLGQAVLMGRKTWDSLPPRFRPLPGRRNMVLTRQAGWQAEGAEVFADLPSALQALAGVPTACVLGGGDIFAQAMPLAHALELTEIDAVVEGDAYFPAPGPEWQEVVREAHQAAPPNTFSFAFVRYERRP